MVRVEKLEAALGFEPRNNGFADRRLSHLAMPPPQVIEYSAVGGGRKIGNPLRASESRASTAYFSALAMPLWVHAMTLILCFLIAGGSRPGISPW